MGLKSRIFLIAFLFLILCSSAFATNYQMRYNAQTGRGDWVVADSSLYAISDEAYGESWNGITTAGASKNAIYDKIDTIAAGAGGVGVAAGNDTEVQFNDGGTNLGGDSALTWNKTTNALTTTGLISSTGLITTTSLQDSALANCDTIDTDGSGIFKCGADAGAGGGISNVVEDLSPQLGGDLDGQTFKVTATGLIATTSVQTPLIYNDSGSTYIPDLNGATVIDGTIYPRTSAGINTAITEIPSNGAGTIYLSPGIYDMTSQITITDKSVSLIGAGKADASGGGATILQKNAAWSTGCIVSYTNNGYLDGGFQIAN